MKLLIMGPPGAGKGTQAIRIKEKYNIPHISTGDMFRAAISNKTEIGLLAKSYIDKGELVPDEVTNNIVKERLSAEDCKDGFLLDGFPRSLEQAKALTAIFNELNWNDFKVLNLYASNDLLIKRLSGRRICRACATPFHLEFNKPSKDGICDACGGELYQRDDDNESTAVNRLKVYENQTKPIIEYYNVEGNVLEIDGNEPSIEKVFSNIISKLEGNL